MLTLFLRTCLPLELVVKRFIFWQWQIQNFLRNSWNFSRLNLLPLPLILNICNNHDDLAIVYLLVHCTGLCIVYWQRLQIITVCTGRHLHKLPPNTRLWKSSRRWRILSWTWRILGVPESGCWIRWWSSRRGALASVLAMNLGRGGAQSTSALQHPERHDSGHHVLVGVRIDTRAATGLRGSRLCPGVCLLIRWEQIALRIPGRGTVARRWVGGGWLGSRMRRSGSGWLGRGWVGGGWLNGNSVGW